MDGERPALPPRNRAPGVLLAPQKNRSVARPPAPFLEILYEWSVMEESRLIVKQAHSANGDETAAVLELSKQLDAAQASIVLFFCSPHYDLTKLGRAFAEAFSAPVAGCTSAGQIGLHGYVDGGITALSLTSAELQATPYLISSLTESTQATEVGYAAAVALSRRTSRKAFGLLLIDGLSNAEERVAAALFEALADVPVVGGSAADDLSSTGTFVYFEGRFRTAAAVFVLFDTTLPFTTFKVQHVAKGAQKLVITEADADRRLVHEINGKPAAREYAAQIGIDVAELEPFVCAEHPLLLSVAGSEFVRAIRAVNADGSLSFFCAVEPGLVLTLGEPVDALEALRAGFDRASARVPNPAVVIGFDCFSRRREFERRGEAQMVGDFLGSRNVVGFCTYGEQFDALHVNQTFTAVALGGR